MDYCFHWDKKTTGRYTCKATIFSCDGKNEACPFYCTPEQQEASRQKAAARIKTFSQQEQQAIWEKYYMRRDKK